jgi:hypothetical protein
MKFVLSLLVLALVAAAQSAFTGDLDEIQLSLIDIETAAADLNIMEGRLGDLEAAKETILLAETALETAVSAAGYSSSG